MSVLVTERLDLRCMTTDDAEFILQLLNDADFIRFIGDKGVRTIDDACRYILNGPIASYKRHGFGLWLVQLRPSSVSVGMCGLLKREALDDVDIGFAFLPHYRSRGYALEAAAAVMQYGRNVLGLKRIVAIVDPDNGGSIRLLQKIGLTFDRMIRLGDDSTEVSLLASEA